MAEDAAGNHHTLKRRRRDQQPDVAQSIVEDPALIGISRLNRRQV